MPRWAHIIFGHDLSRDKDPDPVGSVDFWPAGSRSITFSHVSRIRKKMLEPHPWIKDLGTGSTF